MIKKSFHINTNDRVKEAMNLLLVDSPFYASILLQLELIEDESISTFAINSSSMAYNPSFAESLSMKALKIVILHEISHLVMRHHLRANDILNYNHHDWNISGDLAINSAIWHLEGFPEGALVPGRGDYREFPMSLSAEDYYKMIQKAKEDQKDDQSDQSNDPQEDSHENVTDNTNDENNDDQSDPDSPCDTSEGMQDDNSESEFNPFGQFEACEGDEEELEAENDKITKMVCEGIACCEASGEDLPPPIARNLKAILPQPSIPWKAVLRNCISATKTAGTNWHKPSRRSVGSLIMPSRKVKQVGDVMFAVDVSGSIDEAMYLEVASEIKSSLSLTASADMWFWSTSIRGKHKLTASTKIEDIKVPIGGGTKITCLFDELKATKTRPKLLIVFSDMWLYERWPQVRSMVKASGVEVLWINQSDYDHDPKIGKVINMKG